VIHGQTGRHPSRRRVGSDGKKRNPRQNIPSGVGFQQPGQRSGLFDGDGVLFAHFHAAFTAEALFSIHRDGFLILHLENFRGADINALFTANAFGLINGRNKSHVTSLLSIGSIRVDPIINIGSLFYAKGLIPNKRPRQALKPFFSGLRC
jgi:hypothetical protein